MTLPELHLAPEAVAAYVDDELADGPHQRARSHIAGCAQCQADVAAQRQAKTMLSRADAPPPPADLMARLAQIPLTADLGAESAAAGGGLLSAPVLPDTSARFGSTTSSPLSSQSPFTTGWVPTPGSQPSDTGLMPAAQPGPHPPVARHHNRLATGGLLGVAAAAMAVGVLGVAGTGPSSASEPAGRPTASNSGQQVQPVSFSAQRRRAAAASADADSIDWRLDRAVSGPSGAAPLSVRGTRWMTMFGVQSAAGAGR